jgi:hypothetical protein
MAKCIANKSREIKKIIELNKQYRENPHRLNSMKVAPRIIYIKNEKD